MIPRLPRAILVIYLKRIGDILLTTPVIAQLRALFPQAQIDFLVYPEYADVLEGNPHLDGIVLFPGRRPWLWPGAMARRRYDWVFDFLANGASAWASFLSRAPHRIAFESRYPRFVHNIQIARPAGPLYSPLEKLSLLERAFPRLGAPGWDMRLRYCRPELFIPQAGKDAWGKTLRGDGFKRDGEPLILLCPQSRRATRRWSASGYAQVARALAESGARVLCLWGPGEETEAARVVSLAGNGPRVQTAPQLKDTQDLGAFLSHADCLVTNCNGTKHVAVALGVPTLTIHMSSDPRVWNPPNPAGEGFHPLHPVLQNPQPEAVLQAVLKLLAAKRAA